MIKKRLIPILLLKDGRMVKTIKFDKMRDVGNPVTAAKIYNAQSADELVFLDIDATIENRKYLKDIINRVTEECFMPLTIGGGVKSVEDIQSLLKIGADKVAINSEAVLNPSLITQSSKKFGSANIVVSIDYKDNEGKMEVAIHRGKKLTGFTPVEWSKKVEALGAGEIMLNCIDRDGVMKGYDIDTIKSVSESVNIPVIACGGAGTLQDFADVLNKTQAAAVAAASIFHFTDQSPIKARAFMKESKLDVRIGV